MSRTRRSKVRSCYFRTPKTKNIQTGETYAAQELKEEGFNVPDRLTARANPKSRKIANAWDDKHISANREQDHRKRGLKE